MVEMSAALLAFESVATKAVGLVVLSEKIRVRLIDVIHINR
jgi:hypothetical protein